MSILSRREFFGLMAFTLSADQKRAIGNVIRDPVHFCRVLLCEDPWEKQIAIMRSVERHERTAVKACHSSGKTRVAANMALWWLARWGCENAIVITTAPTGRQVEKLLWAEIHNLLKKSQLDWPEPKLTELKLDEKCLAIGFATEERGQGVKFAGWHGARLLIIIDEATGVGPLIYDAIDGIMASGTVRLLQLGNPVIPSGGFFDCFTRNKEINNCISISAFDTPNLNGLTIDDLLAMSDDELQDNERPYLVTRKWVKERHSAWGEKSPRYQARVLGQFPQQSEFALFPLAWIEQAAARGPVIKETAVHVGLDVAGPGEDETVLIARQDGHIIRATSWHLPEPTGEVMAEVRRLLELCPRHPVVVNVDSVGIGYHLALRLAEWAGEMNPRRPKGCELVVAPVNVSETAQDSEQFCNSKAEFYWTLRDRFQEGRISGIGPYEVLQSQLSSMLYRHRRGRVQIEPKEEAIKRGVKSPDWAEALMLAYKPDIVADSSEVVEYEERVQISPY